MSDQPVYEFRVSGRLGPVLRSALPELSAATAGSSTIITGCLREAAEIEALLHQLSQFGATITVIHLSKVSGHPELRTRGWPPVQPPPAGVPGPGMPSAEGGFGTTHDAAEDRWGWFESL